MWRPCPQIHDKPVRRWGFELDDLMILGVICGVALIFVHPYFWALFVLCVFGLAYYGKRGKPSGAIVHWLQEMQFIPWYRFSLPGFIPARPRTYSPWVEGV